MTPDNIDTKALRELEAKATPGPWRWNVNLNSRHIYLESEARGRMLEVVMDFVRWGMGGAAPRFRSENDLMVRAEAYTEVVPGREHHESWYRTLNHPDAEAIVALRNAAPSLLAAVEAQRKEIDEAGSNYARAERELSNTVEECRVLFSERDALKAEVERLRAALESIVHPTEAAKNYIDYGIGLPHQLGELVSACRKAYNAALRGEEASRGE